MDIAVLIPQSTQNRPFSVIIINTPDLHELISFGSASNPNTNFAIYQLTIRMVGETRIAETNTHQFRDTARESNKARLMSSSSNPPGPSPLTGLRNMRDFQQRPLAFLSELDARYGGVVRFPTALLPVYLVTDPAAVKHVLQDNYRNYSKDTFTYKMISALVGESLLTSDGSEWLRRRRMLQPVFHHRYIVSFVDTMTEVIQEMLARWANQSDPLDLVEEMMRLSLRIASKTLFSVDLDDEAQEIRDALNTSADEALSQFRSPLAAAWTLLGFPPPGSQRFQVAQKRLDDLLYRLIHERRQQTEKPYDVLSLLLEAVDEETGESMTDEEIRNEIGTLLTAGHETTALGLTWTWILLAQHSDIETRLRREVREVVAGERVRLEELASLPYTDAIFQEALRLYPPVWGFSRRAVEDDVINRYPIPAGARIMLSPYVTQHSSHYWTDSERFDPTRFLPERREEQAQFAHFPFGGGPRQCIGKSFALMEAHLVIASLVSRYRWKLVDTEPIRPVAQGTLRPGRRILAHLVPSV